MLRKAVLCCLFIGGINGCSGLQKDDLPPSPVHHSLFHRALEGEYLRLATVRESRNDMEDALYFREKAQAAARGEDVLPQEISERTLSEAMENDLFYARQDLLIALNGGGRTNHPIQAARAQASGFDCWIESLEGPHRPEYVTECKETLTKAMAALGRLVDPKEEFFVIHFRPSFINPNAASRAVLKRVVARWKERGAETFVTISGHTDTAGDPKKNLALSQKRAERVASLLAKQGLDPKYMILQAYGEQTPLVPSGKNALRPGNRRVEIRFENAL